MDTLLFVGRSNKTTTRRKSSEMRAPLTEEVEAAAAAITLTMHRTHPLQAHL